jgi:hypothetical protein
VSLRLSPATRRINFKEISREKNWEDILVLYWSPLRFQFVVEIHCQDSRCVRFQNTLTTSPKWASNLCGLLPSSVCGTLCLVGSLSLSCSASKFKIYITDRFQIPTSTLCNPTLYNRSPARSLIFNKWLQRANHHHHHHHNGLQPVKITVCGVNDWVHQPKTAA